MYTDSKVCIFNTNIESLTSGNSVGVTERKIMMSFSKVNDNPTLKATYFDS